MKKTKKWMILGVAMMGLFLVGGCQSRSGEINTISGDVIERLPDDQKDLELDKALASMRRARKQGYSSSNGSDISIAPNGMNLPGQSENIPKFEDLDEEVFQIMYDYLENVLNIPKRPGYGYDTSSCLDPRINAIYDSEDKGLLTGYENENIFIYEFETAEDDVYSYLFVVRDSLESPWKVIHHGNSYKSE